LCDSLGSRGFYSSAVATGIQWKLVEFRG